MSGPDEQTACQPYGWILVKNVLDYDVYFEVEASKSNRRLRSECCHGVFLDVGFVIFTAELRVAAVKTCLYKCQACTSWGLYSLITSFGDVVGALLYFRDHMFWVYLLRKFHAGGIVLMRSQSVTSWSVSIGFSRRHRSTYPNQLWRPSPGNFRQWLWNHNLRFRHDSHQYEPANHSTTLVLEITCYSPTLVQPKFSPTLTLVRPAASQNSTLILSIYRSYSKSDICTLKRQPGFDHCTDKIQSDFRTRTMNIVVCAARQKEQMIVRAWPTSTSADQ